MSEGTRSTCRYLSSDGIQNTLCALFRSGSIRLTDVAFKTGIEKHAVDGKTVSVYSREKTLADCFRRRNDVGLDVAIEALKFCMAQGNVKVDLIMEHATKLRVAKTIRPYLESLL